LFLKRYVVNEKRKKKRRIRKRGMREILRVNNESELLGGKANKRIAHNINKTILPKRRSNGRFFL